MSDISTENLYWCTLALKKDIENKENYKYTFASKDKDDEGRTIFYDIIGKKYYRIINSRFSNDDEYYVIDRVKLSNKKQDIKLATMRKFLRYFDVFDKKIDEVCNKEYVIKKGI